MQSTALDSYDGRKQFILSEGFAPTGHDIDAKDTETCPVTGSEMPATLQMNLM